MITKNVTLNRGDAGFGFSVIGGSDTYLPPMIFTLAPGQPADTSQQVDKGDRILSVNSVSVVNVSSKQVIQLINDSTSVMLLCLQDDADLKKRLNAFMTAKTRSTSPAPASRPASTARPLYQPVSTRLANGSPALVSKSERGPPTPEPRSPDTRSPLTASPVRSPGAPPPATKPDGPPRNDMSPIRSSPKAINRTPSKKEKRREKTPVKQDESPSRHYSTVADYDDRKSDGLKQTSLSLLSQDPVPHHNSTALSPRTDSTRESRDVATLFDIQPTFDESPYNEPGPESFPVYAKPVKKSERQQNTLSNDVQRPFSGVNQVYHPPPEYELSEPPIPQHPADVPPDIPARETAESCARRLFYQDGCTPADASHTLASTNPFDEDVAHFFMQHFNFDNFKLDDAVRVFVERAPLMGENSDRGRILFHLSKHLYQTNHTLRQQLQGPEEIHTLVCALMMLNTDLHSGMVDRRMTYAQFETNLKSTNNAYDKGVLKELYNGIKAKPLMSSQPSYIAEPPKQNTSIEQYENVVHKQGPMNKKNFLLASGKKPGLFKRRWHRYDVQLKGSNLMFSKHSSGKKLTIICHHCLVSRAEVRKGRHSVMHLVCADGRQILLQARDDTDMQEWVHTINKVAAMFSAPPMAPPVSNSNTFQKASLPMSRSKCTLEQQLQNHMAQIDKLTREYDELIRQQSNQHTPSMDWIMKKSYLESEKEKYEEYSHLLNSLLYPQSEEALMSPASFGRATANRMSYKRAVQKNVEPVNV